MAASDRPSSQKSGIDIISGNAKVTGGEQAQVGSWAAPITDSGLGDLARGLGQVGQGANQLAAAFRQRQEQQDAADLRLAVATATATASQTARQEYQKYKDEDQDPDTFVQGSQERVADIIKQGFTPLQERFKNKPKLLAEARTLYGVASANMYDQYNADAVTYSQQLRNARTIELMDQVQELSTQAAAEGNLQQTIGYQLERARALETLTPSQMAPEKRVAAEREFYSSAAPQIQTAAVENFRKSAKVILDNPELDPETALTQKKDELFTQLKQAAVLFRQNPTGLSSLLDKLDSEFSQIQRGLTSAKNEEAKAVYNDAVASFSLLNPITEEQKNTLKRYAQQFDPSQIRTINLMGNLQSEISLLQRMVNSDPTGKSPEVDAALMRFEEGKGVLPDGSDVSPEDMAEYRTLAAPVLGRLQQLRAKDPVTKYMVDGMSAPTAKLKVFNGKKAQGRPPTELAGTLVTEEESITWNGQLESAAAGLPKLNGTGGSIATTVQIYNTLQEIDKNISAVGPNPEYKALAFYKLYDSAESKSVKRVLAATTFLLPPNPTGSNINNAILAGAASDPDDVATMNSNYAKTVDAVLAASEPWRKFITAKVNGAGASAVPSGMVEGAYKAARNYILTGVTKAGIAPADTRNVKAAAEGLLAGIIENANVAPDGTKLTKAAGVSIMTKGSKINVSQVTLPATVISATELNSAARILQSKGRITEHFSFAATGETEWPSNFRLINTANNDGVKVQYKDNTNMWNDVLDVNSKLPVHYTWDDLKQLNRADENMGRDRLKPEAAKLLEEYRKLPAGEAARRREELFSKISEIQNGR